MLDHLSTKRIDWQKPRKEGITYIVDKFQGFDSANFRIISPLIDIVKIYGPLPLLISNDQLMERINFYHEHDILVSVGSDTHRICFVRKII